MSINFFGTFGLITIVVFSAIGFLLLPMWLQLTAWILKNLRYFLKNFADLSWEWIEAVRIGIITNFNVVIYGEYDKPVKPARQKEQP